MPRISGDLWQWLSDSAHFYVCGAVRMGQDVERAMVDIVAEYGRNSASEATAIVTDLKKRGRYQADVY
jgi:sulfite reductase (NADPH) flavoprotein alpha-component